MVAQELATALKCHWVFGNSYLCLDQGDLRDSAQQDNRLLVNHSPENDSQSALNSIGMHGNAILSRYPLLQADNCSLFITKDKFESRYEKRLGHKRGLWATADTPWGEITLAVAHLDAFASPHARYLQAQDLLGSLNQVSPLIFAGDLNTTTFSMGAVSNILSNLPRALRGVRHTLHHYLHPYEQYERALFELFQAHQLEWQSFNDLRAETFRFDFNDPVRIAELHEKLPAWVVRWMRARAQPHGGVARGRLDWCTARGVQALGTNDRQDVRGGSLAPRVLQLRDSQGRELSDHDVILTDLVIQS